MFQERYRKAMLRIAIQLGRVGGSSADLAIRFWDLSKKKPVVPKPDLQRFIFMIKWAEENALLVNDRLTLEFGDVFPYRFCEDIANYLSAFNQTV